MGVSEWRWQTSLPFDVSLLRVLAESSAILANALTSPPFWLQQAEKFLNAFIYKSIFLTLFPSRLALKSSICSSRIISKRGTCKFEWRGALVHLDGIYIYMSFPSNCGAQRTCITTLGLGNSRSLPSLLVSRILQHGLWILKALKDLHELSWVWRKISFLMWSSRILLPSGFVRLSSSHQPKCNQPKDSLAIGCIHTVQICKSYLCRKLYVLIICSFCALHSYILHIVFRW